MDVNVKKVNELQEFYAGGTHYNNWNPQDRDSLKKQLSFGKSFARAWRKGLRASDVSATDLGLSPAYASIVDELSEPQSKT